jgi:hypothetical protein
MSLEEAREKRESLNELLRQYDPNRKFYYKTTVDHLGRHREVAKKRYYDHCLVIWLKKGYERKDLPKELREKRQIGNLALIIESCSDE